MSQVIDLQQYAMRKAIKNEVVCQETEYEIVLTVAKSIYEYMKEELDDPLDVLTLHASTSELFEKDRNRFMAALLQILTYWKIDLEEEGITLIDKEFELFPTVEKVFSFVEERVL